MEIDRSEYLGEPCQDVYYNRGCGALNMPGVQKCEGCHRIIVSTQNNRGESFLLGQEIYFNRAHTGLLEAGYIVKFIAGDDGIFAIVKYKECYVADKFDEVHSLNGIFSSPSVASSIPRQRRAVTPLVAEQKSTISQSQSQTQSALTIKKLQDMDRSKKAKQASAAAVRGECQDHLTMSTSSSGSDTGNNSLSGLSSSSPTGFLVLDSSTPSYMASSKSTMQLEKFAVRKPLLSAKSIPDDEYGEYAENSSVDAKKKRPLSSQKHNQLEFSGVPARQLVLRPMRGCNVDDVLRILNFDSEAYPERFCTSVENIIVSWNGEDYSVPIDACVKRGLVQVLMHWVNPPRLKAEIEELGTKAWIADIFVIELEQFIQALPTNAPEMAKLACFHRLNEIEYDWTMPAEYCTAIWTANNYRICTSAPRRCNDQTTDEVSGVDATDEVQVSGALRVHRLTMADAVANIIGAYLAKRGSKVVSILDVPTVSTIGDEIPLLAQFKLYDLNIKRLPLKYDQFFDVMEATFWYFGGRKAIEGSPSIKGVKIKVVLLSNIRAIGGKEAMYGGVMEHVIETIIERTRMNSSDVFYDVGSGIGQICIQVAATVGCKCFGVEIDEARHQIALKLIKQFDWILEQLGCVGRLSDRVKLFNLDLVHPEAAACTRESSVIFFDNYGPWFSKQLRQEKPPIQVFCEQITECKIGTQICTLTPLIEVSDWLHCEQIDSGVGGFSWTIKSIPMPYYTILSHEWSCKNCTMLNPIGIDACSMCETSRKSKRTGKSCFTA